MNKDASISLPAKKVIMAWNGGLEATTALRKSLAWLAKGALIDVVIVNAEDFKTGPNPGDDAAGYRACIGFDVTVHGLSGGNGKVSEVLLVMGGYGHSRFRGLLFGGTTQDMIGNGEIPVFMAH